MMVRYGVGSAVGAALLLTIVSAAQAGDAAARRIIGFSPDGNYFAVTGQAR
jgi:predicted secreted protein